MKRALITDASFLISFGTLSPTLGEIAAEPGFRTVLMHGACHVL
jgi:hypothetical protein